MFRTPTVVDIAMAVVGWGRLLAFTDIPESKAGFTISSIPRHLDTHGTWEHCDRSCVKVWPRCTWSISSPKSNARVVPERPHRTTHLPVFGQVGVPRNLYGASGTRSKVKVDSPVPLPGRLFSSAASRTAVDF